MRYNVGKMQKVYCIIPTRNRLSCLKNIINILNQQTYSVISVIVIDDGSTDGTHDYLEHHALTNLTVIEGDGELWWGGATAVGMKAAILMAADSDVLLLLNDDCVFDENYIKLMLEKIYSMPPGAVVSPQYDVNSKMYAYAGYKIDHYKQSITHVKCEPIDASVGRGLMIPVNVVKNIGIINARKFPHYMGDIEYSARIKDFNYRLEVAWNAPMYSDLNPSDMPVQNLGGWRKWLHKRSKSNIFDVLKLFHRRGPFWTRFTAFPRMVSRLGVSSLRSMLNK